MQPWHPFTQASALPVLPASRSSSRSRSSQPTRHPAGHSLRLDVGPNDFPHAVPPVSQLTASLGGVVQVLHDPQHPSYLELACLGACCRAMPVPHLIRG
jgi:X-Pro dipeptidyl-peptidase C-terminal non-catalytic domain.